MDSELEQFALEDVAEEDGDGGGHPAVGGRGGVGVRRRPRGHWDSSSGSEDERGGGGGDRFRAASGEPPKGPLKTQVRTIAVAAGEAGSGRRVQSCQWGRSRVSRRRCVWRAGSADCPPRRFGPLKAQVYYSARVLPEELSLRCAQDTALSSASAPSPPCRSFSAAAHTPSCHPSPPSLPPPAGHFLQPHTLPAVSVHRGAPAHRPDGQDLRGGTGSKEGGWRVTGKAHSSFSLLVSAWQTRTMPGALQPEGMSTPFRMNIGTPDLVLRHVLSTLLLPTEITECFSGNPDPYRHCPPLVVPPSPCLPPGAVHQRGGTCSGT